MGVETQCSEGLWWSREHTAGQAGKPGAGRADGRLPQLAGPRASTAWAVLCSLRYGTGRASGTFAQPFLYSASISPGAFRVSSHQECLWSGITQVPLLPPPTLDSQVRGTWIGSDTEETMDLTVFCPF